MKEKALMRSIIPILVDELEYLDKKLDINESLAVLQRSKVDILYKIIANREEMIRLQGNEIETLNR